MSVPTWSLSCVVGTFTKFGSQTVIWSTFYSHVNKDSLNTRTHKVHPSFTIRQVQSCHSILFSKDTFLCLGIMKKTSLHKNKTFKPILLIKYLTTRFVVFLFTNKKNSQHNKIQNGVMTTIRQFNTNSLTYFTWRITRTLIRPN